MKRNPSTRIALVLLFALAMFFGWHFGDSPGPSKPSEVNPSKSRIARQSSSPRAAAIDEIRKSGSLLERFRLTIALAESIPLAEIDKWLESRRFNPGDGYETTLFTRILTDRRSLAAPGELTPAALLESFLEHAVCGFPEGETPEFTNMLQLFAMLAEKDPTALEAALGKLIIPYRNYAEDALLSRRLATSFDDEIRKLWARQDGWHLFKDHAGDPEMLAKLFKNPADLPQSWRNRMAQENWARRVLLESSEFWWDADLAAAGFSGEQAGKIRKEALSGIARQNPAKALPLLNEVKLNTSERKKLIQDVFLSGGLSDENAHKYLKLLKTDEDLQFAQEVLKRKQDRQIQRGL